MIGVLGIEDVDLSNEVTISYNNSSSQLEINNKANTDFECEIYSVSGRKILSGKIYRGSNTVEPGVIAQGVYTVSLHSSKGVVRKAFVKL